MTTYTDVISSSTGAFQFLLTLDGQTYSAQVTWPVFSQRPYLTIFDNSNDVLVNRALIGSPPQQTLAALSWLLGTVTATCAVPHGLTLGSVVNLTVAGTTPAGYSGAFQCAVTGPTTFTYALADYPGSAATVAGAYGPDLNLAQGYFQTSTLIWRPSNGQIEVNP